MGRTPRRILEPPSIRAIPARTWLGIMGEEYEVDETYLVFMEITRHQGEREAERSFY